MTHILALTRVKGYENMVQRLESLTRQKFTLIDRPELMTRDHLESIKPEYLFLPHWSKILPRDIYENFECVIFHMTDLPFGRGGSPLQNLISRGFEKTKISAIRCVNEIDAGPIYLKRDFTLEGRAEEIYQRAALEIEKMIAEIVLQRPTPVPQTGDITVFKRRTPEESDVSRVNDLKSLFDHIRMLDAEGYPKAFLENQNFRFEFDHAEFTDGSLTAKVTVHPRIREGK